MLLRTATAALVLTAGLAAAPVVADEPLARPGLWEITMTSKGMMGMPPSTVTSKQCLKPEDVEQPEEFAPDVEVPNMECSSGDFTRDGDTMTWQVACISPEMSMEGDGTFKSLGPDAYEGVVNLKMMMENMPQAGGMSFEITTDYQARRLGDC